MNKAHAKIAADMLPDDERNALKSIYDGKLLFTNSDAVKNLILCRFGNC